MFKSTISWLSILVTKRRRRRGENGRRSTRRRRRARRSTRRSVSNTRGRDLTNISFLITMTWDSYFSTSASIYHYLYKKGKK